ncbi:MAG: galactose oxidase early set domain-containing protein, partial [Cyanobacteria bacterium J06631_2]
PFVPAEIWQGEIFSPPYLFKPGQRPEIVSAPETIEYGQTGAIALKDATEKGSLVLNKLGSVTHSIDNGQRLVELPSKLVDDSSLEFTAPTNANLYPPGYYMMFYLNDIGKPSHAKIVRLTN